MGRLRSGRLATARHVLVLGVLLSASPLVAREWTLTLIPESTGVTFTLDATAHTVEGSFRLEAGEIRVDDEARTISGEITVDARSGTTGIGRRDRIMHASVVESDRYPRFSFRPARFQGEFNPDGSSTFLLVGTITIQGSDHALSIPVTTEVHGDRLVARTAFRIPYVEWGMKDPSTWLLRVAKEVVVSVRAEGALYAGR